MDLIGKFALVTGGANGIGLAIVKKLLKEGAKGVCIVDINEEKCRQAADSLQETYKDRTVMFVKTDVSSEEQFKGAFAETVNTLKHLDIVVNVAGMCSESHWEKMIDVNIKGTTRGTFLALEFLPKYKQSTEGVLVNMASGTGLEPVEAMPVYSTTKAAIIHLGRALSGPATYERTKTRVLTVCPGPTVTDMLDDLLKSMGTNFENIKNRIQSAEWVAKGVVDAIKSRPHGSLFVVEQSEEPYEVVLPKRSELKKNST